MLRRIPVTPLVCLVICLLAFAAGPAAAADPQEALEILLKPGEGGQTAKGKHNPPSAQTRPHFPAEARAAHHHNSPSRPHERPITKVKPPFIGACVSPDNNCAPAYAKPPCILPQPMPRQWDMSAQAIFARTKGTIAWPRVSPYYYYYGENMVDLNDMLQIPAHKVLLQLSARYQFRWNWGLRYTILTGEIAGGGYNWSNQQFQFGPGYGGYFYYGQNLNSKWEHQYHRLGLVYDAIKTCSTNASVFADWVHTEDKISVSCSYCYNANAIFSKGGDSAMAGFEFRQCLKTAPNGGSLSCDNKAGFIFGDDVEGWDLETGLRYAIPVNCGRWGYVKGGYRFIEVKKSQPDFYWKNTIDGGFLEAGFIF